MKIFLIALFPLLAVAQQANAQVSHPFRVQVYSGGPSILKTAFNFSSSFQDLVTYSGTALIGFSADYRVNNWLSVGLDATYRYGELNMDITDSSDYVYLRDKWGLNEADIPNPYGHYRLELPRYRIMAMATVHALGTEQPSDIYAQFGLGYNRVAPMLYVNEKEVEYFKRIGTFSLPLAYRLSAGYAYHFANYVGVFGEIGIGGPIFTVGVSGRF